MVNVSSVMGWVNLEALHVPECGVEPQTPQVTARIDVLSVTPASVLAGHFSGFPLSGNYSFKSLLFCGSFTGKKLFYLFSVS